MGIKPDIIVVWPKDTDFPLFRYNLKRYRKYFDKVLIAVSDNGTLENYTDFFHKELSEIAQLKFVPRADGTKDWRNVAVNTMLEKSTASHVLFIEPDFLIKDERFFEVLLNMSDYDFIYYDEGGRVHPACALVPRHLIERTSKDFSARPPAYDHFGLFFMELLRISNSADLDTLGIHDREDYYHLAGLTQNYHARPYYKPNEFLTYNRLCLKLPVRFNDFRLRMEQIDTDPSSPFLIADVVANMFPKEEKE